MIPKFGACVYLPDNDALGISNLRVIVEPWVVGWGGGCLFVLEPVQETCNLKMNLFDKLSPSLEKVGVTSPSLEILGVI